MKALLDTHTLLWWAHEPEKLSVTVARLIGDGANAIVVSAVSAMEITTKSRRNRLEYKTSLASIFSQRISEFGFETLSISCAHAECAGNLPGDHHDPWDRLLAAQSRSEGLPLLSVDKRMAAWDVELIW